MYRGMYNSLCSNKAYLNTEKDWFIELTQSSIYWYDLLVNDSQDLKTKKHIREQLLLLKENVEKSIKKRFIYFIFSRTKVRFDIKRQPRTSLFSDKMKVFILVGKTSKRMSVSFPTPINSNNKKMTATVNDKFIFFNISENDKYVISIHDFLKDNNINIGANSKIQYVGYTKNPEIRPTNGAHAGLSHICIMFPMMKTTFLFHLIFLRSCLLVRNQQKILIFIWQIL